MKNPFLPIILFQPSPNNNNIDLAQLASTIATAVDTASSVHVLKLR